MSSRKKFMALCAGYRDMRQDLKRASVRAEEPGETMEKLMSARDISTRYGLSLYQARILMLRAGGRVNVGSSDEHPRWVTPESRIEAYIRKRKDVTPSGLDADGKLIRK